MILAPGVYATTFRGEDGRRVVGVKIGARYLVVGWFVKWTR